MVLGGVFSPLGTSIGMYLAPRLAETFHPELHVTASLVFGLAVAAFAGLNESLVYRLNPVERRARQFAKISIPSAWEKLVETIPNPRTDLNYGHVFPQRDGSHLSITNRQVLDLRASG